MVLRESSRLQRVCGVLIRFRYFITPVSAISFRDEEIDIPMGDSTSGYYAALLKKWLKDIMYGNVQHEWGAVIDEE